MIKKYTQPIPQNTNTKISVDTIIGNAGTSLKGFYDENTNTIIGVLNAELPYQCKIVKETGFHLSMIVNYFIHSADKVWWAIDPTFNLIKARFAKSNDCYYVNHNRLKP